MKGIEGSLFDGMQAFIVQVACFSTKEHAVNKHLRLKRLLGFEHLPLFRDLNAECGVAECSKNIPYSPALKIVPSDPSAQAEKNDADGKMFFGFAEG